MRPRAPSLVLKKKKINRHAKKQENMTHEKEE
jgi:hypothetical protein